MIFTGERTERRLYVVDYRNGKVLLRYPLDRNPVGVKFLGDVEWDGKTYERVVAVIGSRTPEKVTGVLLLWEERKLLEGKSPFVSFILNMGSPADFVKIGSKIFVVPYSGGSLEEIDLSNGNRHLYSFPYTALSWGATFADYCQSIDKLCIASTTAERILIFDYRDGQWDGEIVTGFKPYNFQDIEGELYITAHNPGGVYFIGDGKFEKILEVNGYSFVRVVDSKVFVSLFNQNDFRIIER